jgi:uncharacterized membrane-anchored protein YjiN (DUF445 family)
VSAIPTAAVTEADQATALRRARIRATGLLAVVAVLFLASFALPDTTATGYLRSALEAGLVGGLADWFAVVALFRYPLGIPIPHTAVIPRSKDGLGANLASFVRDNFLARDQVRERLVDRAHVERLGAWMARPDNADRVAVQVAVLGAGVLDAVDEEQVIDRITAAIRVRLAAMPLAEAAGTSLADAVTAGQHAPAVTAAVAALRGIVADNRQMLRRRLGQQSPAWVPEAVDDLVFERAERVIDTFLRQLADDPDHELRRTLDRQLLALAERMTVDGPTAERVNRTVQDLLSEDLVRRWVAGWWVDLHDAFRAAGDVDAADTELRRAVRDALVDLGERLGTDARLQDRVLAALEAAAPQIAAAGQREIGALIAATVDRWDAEDTSRRLELWMGRDLQFVRINGTVVGALVGLILHSVTLLLA